MKSWTGICGLAPEPTTELTKSTRFFSLFSDFSDFSVFKLISGIIALLIPWLINAVFLTLMKGYLYVRFIVPTVLFRVFTAECPRR
jgi:hypothetical protein